MENPEKLATICVGHHYTQTNTNNVNKTWVLLFLVNLVSPTLSSVHLFFKLMCTTRFWNNFQNERSKWNDWKVK